MWSKDSEDREGYSVIGIGPKFSLVENKFAFYLPIGKALGENTSDTWQMHPAILFTIPAVKDAMDITLSPKYLIRFCEECDNLVAVNLGISFSNDMNKWSFRPESGVLFNPGESGYFMHFSIGFSYILGK